jgi:xylulokinase
MPMPAASRVVAPDPALRQAYSDQYQRYRALYPAIEEARK